MELIVAGYMYSYVRRIIDAAAAFGLILIHR